MPFGFAILLLRLRRVASGQRIDARRRAVMLLRGTVVKSNFFDYDRPSRELRRRQQADRSIAVE